MDVVVQSAMQTPDGLWQVQVVRRRGQRTSWYRIVRGDGDAVVDWLSISAVQRILQQSGVDLATLVPVDDLVIGAEEQEQAAGSGAA